MIIRKWRFLVLLAIISFVAFGCPSNKISKTAESTEVMEEEEEYDEDDDEYEDEEEDTVSYDDFVEEEIDTTGI